MLAKIIQPIPVIVLTIIHIIFCLAQSDIRGLSQKIVYIGCYWKSNERIELIFSHMKDILSMHIIAKYHTLLPISNENIASCITLGFTVRRTSTLSWTSRQIFFTVLNFIAISLE